ncbi:hypothetical protein ACJRPK_04380 [Aquimarina sp. 2-A2]|uniref:Uncharacterized protein n=1 Tax=Aquimarina intermedia TaxID=350814 RepID=A0A5S5CD13_9FLAO|nr:hypothetical protein BD809_101379 [Aquimarina intermedia]
MKLIEVRRQTKLEKRYHKKMGILTSKVVYIKKYFLNIPMGVVHKYRETYYGETKDCKECELLN